MTSQLVTFYLGAQIFGIDILLVREINRHLDTTVVQLAPDYIIGLSNLRGQIVTIVDPWVRMGLARQGPNEDVYNIIVKTNNELAPLRARGSLDESVGTCRDPVGIRADNIGDIIDVESKRIEPVPANLGIVEEQFLSGVVPTPSQLIIILNVARLLDAA